MTATCSAAQDVESVTVTRILRENELIASELVRYKQLCAAMAERHSHALHSINSLKAICDKLSVKWDQNQLLLIRANETICDHSLEKLDKQVEHIRQQIVSNQNHNNNDATIDSLVQTKNNSNEVLPKRSTISTSTTTTSTSTTHWNNRQIANNFSNGDANPNKYRCEYGCNQLFARKEQMDSHMRVHTSMQEAIACGHILSVVPTNSTSPTSSPTIDVTTYDRLKDNCGVGKVSEVIFVPQVEFEVIDYHNNNSNNSANDSSLSFNNSNNNSEENSVNNRCEKALICCDLCGKQFSKHYIQSHRRSHTGVKPYKCSFTGCERTFTQTSSRNFHEKTYHRCDKYALFRCYYRNCDKSFSRQIDLQKHMNHHNGNVGNSGNFCAQDAHTGGRVAKTRQLRRVSHRAGKHECTHCGKTFAHKVALRQHEVIHGNKEFVCQIANCDYASFWKQNLSLHLRRHHNQQ